ncbi:MAG: dihydroorotate dehydrogenase [Negativicutes bacterium]
MNLSVNIGSLHLNNPVIAASGCFGFGREYSEYVDLNKLGAISVKGLTLEPRQGNAAPRCAETPGGMLNSVGLQNPGVHYFIEQEIPFLRQYSAKIIANIAGNSLDDYCQMAAILDDTDIDAIELNVSCPNVKAGCMAFGSSVDGISEVVSAVRARTVKTLIVKLTPNVRDIKEIALAAERNGADAVSLINTLLGMAIDINKKRPILANNYGGLSGAAVKPVALRMVHEVTNCVKIPVIGMGGICCWQDAIEFMLAGASAVMVGTANFINPLITIEIATGIEAYMRTQNYLSIEELNRALKMN